RRPGLIWARLTSDSATNTRSSPIRLLSATPTSTTPRNDAWGEALVSGTLTPADRSSRNRCPRGRLTAAADGDSGPGVPAGVAPPGFGPGEAGSAAGPAGGAVPAVGGTPAGDPAPGEVPGVCDRGHALSTLNASGLGSGAVARY